MGCVGGGCVGACRRCVDRDGRPAWGARRQARGDEPDRRDDVFAGDDRCHVFDLWGEVDDEERRDALFDRGNFRADAGGGSARGSNRPAAGGALHQWREGVTGAAWAKWWGWTLGLGIVLSATLSLAVLVVQFSMADARRTVPRKAFDALEHTGDRRDNSQLDCPHRRSGGAALFFRMDQKIGRD